jgi:hypothetical protein
LSHTLPITGPLYGVIQAPLISSLAIWAGLASCMGGVAERVSG